MRCSRPNVLLLFLVLALPALASAQSLSEVLRATSRNVKTFQDQLPDFICNERITSTMSEYGKIRKEKIVESIFTGVQRSSEENQVRFAFAESREVVAIDGKPARKGTAFPKLPYRFAGGFSSLLIKTFAPENLEYHDYSIGDRYRSESADSLLVRFATKEGQNKLRAIFQGEQLIERDVGAAWVDAASFQVRRLMRQSLNLPSGFSRSAATVDYGPVIIDDKEFWMPRTVSAELTERYSGATLTYLAEYSDCKKFSADIRFLPPQ